MTYAFLGSFVLGLILAVRAMLHGVERPSESRAPRSEGTRAAPSASLPRRFALNVPTIAGFATAFGVTGYLLMRYAPLTTLSDILIAAAVGVAGAVGALTLVAAWAIPAAKAEVVDERYLLQGAFARVTAVSERGMSGTVVYESEGRSHTARAAPLEGCRLEVGGDVVIERIEDNVAYVEPWARVEARL